MPRSLDLNRLKSFESKPREAAAPAELPRALAEEPKRWPSREPVTEGQISIKAPTDVIARFRAICKDDRRTYADMLHILMDCYEGQK
ncbi:hypothetical protein C5F48_22875 [Cereibacter changlensis JA139]|uniref:Uncharacterized protein n=2 Tax=Cereibacter changlensis TaxID=402884 RepID=A0A2T4JNG0_9RHOB|nr:hypothetical protein [Cereibacter changlensis]PTE19449.1 hypothetical protein C5F48_22875 [Cereibacter changlensis JA139]PZX46885.1 hypothetical protein LX76_04597 [Cereibacter changlensis]